MSKISFSSEMFELFNVNDQKGLTVFEIENGVVDMTQTGEAFDRLVNLAGAEIEIKQVSYLFERPLDDTGCGDRPFVFFQRL